MHYVDTKRKDPNSKWVQNAPKVGQEYMQDEFFLADMNLTKPIWGYVVDKFRNKAMDALNSMDQYLKEDMGRIIMLGEATQALAIELSQWGYDVIHVSATEMGRQKLLKDSKFRAGLVKEAHTYDYFNHLVPKGRILIFVGVIDRVKTGKWIDRQLKQVDELIFCVANNKDWDRILSKYKVEVIKKDGTKSYYSLTNRRR